MFSKVPINFLFIWLLLISEWVNFLIDLLKTCFKKIEQLRLLTWGSNFLCVKICITGTTPICVCVCLPACATVPKIMDRPCMSVPLYIWHLLYQVCLACYWDKTGIKLKTTYVLCLIYVLHWRIPEVLTPMGYCTHALLKEN